MNQIMRERHIAILAVQETHLKQTDIDEIHSQFYGRMEIKNSSDPDHPNAKGVAFVLNKQKTAWKEALVTEIIPGRAIRLEIPWQEARINILAIYAPNSPAENAEFWETLHNKWVQENPPLPDIVLGDFNLVEEMIDRLPAHADAHGAVDKLREFKALLGLSDGWRRTNPMEKAYSFTQEATQSRSRIDRIYVTQPMYKNSWNWQIDQTAIRTDHHLVSVEFANPGAPFIGKGRWSIPLRLLKNRKVIKEIKEIGMTFEKKIDEAKTQPPDRRTFDKNPQVLFADFKIEIASFAREFAKTETPKLDAKIKSSKEQLKGVLNDENVRPVEEVQATAAAIEEKIRQLETLCHTQVQNNLAVRSRLESETIGKFWIQNNKEKTPRDTVQRLRIPQSPPHDPKYTKKSSEMADLARSYHENLQKNGLVEDLTDEDFQEVLEHLKPRVNAEGRTELARYLKEEEISQALRDLPDGKAPGIDGIPHEMWKILRILHMEDLKAKRPAFNIVKVLTQVYNDIEEHGLEPHTTFPKGWMCLLYKKGDTAEIGNYCPITVLNTDYKIMTRVLTMRLTKIVPNLIHHDQAGFMKGRRIEDQTELVRLMINQCEANEQNGVIVCLDQEKAYDKVQHDFIWKTLEAYQFPNHFINTIKTLYKNGETVIVINGVISEPYRITRGVRQGDPLSCLIFNLAIESLASMLCNSTLSGFTIKGEVERLITTLFADDTTVYLSEDDSFHDLQEILQTWCRVSGAKFNVNKTIIIPVGTHTYRQEVLASRRMNQVQLTIPDEIKIATDGTPVRVLGAYVGNNVTQTAVWTPVLEKIDVKLKRWARSHPTQDGKRLIIGMEVGGLSQYLTRVQGMPKEIEETLNRKVTKFLWDGASAMVNLETMIQPITKGGKRVLDIKARNEAIELMKVKSYLNFGPERPRWAKVADTLIAENMPKGQQSQVRDDASRRNTFLQNWSTKKKGNSNLPESLRRMLNVAEKYNVSVDPPVISQNVKRGMPIWHHIGFKKDCIVQNNNQWAKCQREVHEIQTIGDMEKYIQRNPRHSGNKRCPCDKCKTARTKGCEHPGKCHKAARKMLDSLEHKWDPKHDDTPRNQDELAEDGENRQEVLSAFNTQDDLRDEFRVFVEPGKHSPNPAIVAPQDEEEQAHQTTVYLVTKAVDEQFESAKAVGTVWYGENDDRNETYYRVGPTVTKEGCGIETMARLFQRTPPDSNLVIKTDSKFLLRAVGQSLVKFEDKGWIGITNNKELRILLANIRQRRGHTHLVRANKNDPELKLAKDTARSEIEILEQPSEAPSEMIPNMYCVTGARLQITTQSLLYKGILETRKIKTRKNAELSLGMTRGTQKEISGKEPNDEKIWHSLRSKDISQRARAFLWKVIHGAYKCGKYWRNIPDCEHRGTCQVCNAEESMEHILVECKASGQEHVWKLVEELLSLRNLRWVPPSFGTTIGCCLIDYRSEDDSKPLVGANRLYRIAVSESAHLIWRLRCKWRINDEADPEKIPTEKEIRTTWLNMINRRLQLDCLLTNKHKYGKKALRPSLVEKTWWGVLRNQGNLPENWLSTTGVIVGIGERPPGRNR